MFAVVHVFGMWCDLAEASLYSRYFPTHGVGTIHTTKSHIFYVDTFHLQNITTPATNNLTRI